MLKSILNLSNVQVLSKNDQKQIQGGDSFMCLVMCGPGAGGTPIYSDRDLYISNGYSDTVVTIQEEVGCACS
jgi:hypothetical protein